MEELRFQTNPFSPSGQPELVNKTWPNEIRVADEFLTLANSDWVWLDDDKLNFDLHGAYARYQFYARQDNLISLYKLVEGMVDG